MTYYNQWILHDQLMMGSQIPSEDAFRKLVDNQGITHVLDLEKACDLRFDDPGEASPRVFHMYFPDDGGQRPDWYWRSGFEFARESIQYGGTVFVHCRMGIGRGPSMTYGILRYFNELPEDRTSEIKSPDLDPEEKAAPGRREIIYKAQIEDFLQREIRAEQES